jgi:hypothetical protein
MLRAFLKPASSRGPYDDKTTVTQGGVVYNLTYNGHSACHWLKRLRVCNQCLFSTAADLWPKIHLYTVRSREIFPCADSEGC